MIAIASLNCTLRYWQQLDWKWQRLYLENISDNVCKTRLYAAGAKKNSVLTGYAKQLSAYTKKIRQIWWQIIFAIGRCAYTRTNKKENNVTRTCKLITTTQQDCAIVFPILFFQFGLWNFYLQKVWQENLSLHYLLKLCCHLAVRNFRSFFLVQLFLTPISDAPNAH